MIGKGDNIKSMAYVGNVVAFIKNRLLNKKMGSYFFLAEVVSVFLIYCDYPCL